MSCCLTASATSIETLGENTAPKKFGQAQKILIQRAKSGATRNELVIASANPNLIASWGAWLTAADSTKVTSTPYVHGVDGPNAGDPETFGGGDDTVDGIEIITAATAAAFTGQFHNLDPLLEEKLKSFACEALQVYFINDCGKVIGEVDDLESPTVFRGFRIPAGTFYIGDRVPGKRTQPDMNEIRFQLYAGWSEKMYFVDPSDYDAKEDFINS